MDEDCEFDGYALDSGGIDIFEIMHVHTFNCYTNTFIDSANKAVTTRLIKEVQTQNQIFQASDIHCESTLYDADSIKI